MTVIGRERADILANPENISGFARMISRRITSILAQRLAEVPAVALIGPRQVGKTTVALNLHIGKPSVYLDLESEADRAKLSDPALYLEGHADDLVILDEVHRVPNIFQPLRGVIDQGRGTGKGRGRFLLLGSASVDLLKQTRFTRRFVAHPASPSLASQRGEAVGSLAQSVRA